MDPTNRHSFQYLFVPRVQYRHPQSQWWTVRFSVVVWRLRHIFQTLQSVSPFSCSASFVLLWLQFPCQMMYTAWIEVLAWPHWEILLGTRFEKRQ